MSPLSTTFTCRFETRSQFVRLVFDLELILKRIDIDGKVGRPGLSIFGWWRGVLSGQLIVGRRLRGDRRRGVCRVLLTEWLISVWMETASSRAYTMGLDNRSHDALETRGGHQVFMDVPLFLV